ncbi:MAG: long-chain fatty acid--CoA ligase [Defluviicoccus sp.]|nr:long-chain fatty acid--CoA ligase [Defluviicoccus sp.]MDE0382848.1 long-chain fatty acid--CoA ligase [Defluviicoccus sp.]
MEEDDVTDPLWLAKYPEGVKWDAEIPEGPLFAILEEAVERFPGNEAMDFLGKRYTYAELGDAVTRAAAGFRALGVAKGVKVGLFLPNCPQFVISFFGILKAGGTVVNYSPLYTEDQLAHQIEDSGTEIMVTLGLEALYPKMAALLDRGLIGKLVVGTLQAALPFPKSVLFPLLRRSEIARVPDDDRHLAFAKLLDNDGAGEPPAIDPRADIAVLQYTGGTTGVSKGAMLTHANLHANVHQALMWSPDLVPGEERMMGVLPFFHVFAMTVVMNLTIALGGSIVMRPRFELDPVLEDVTKKKPTLFPGVPTMYTAIVNHPKLQKFDLTSIKICLSGGAPLPGEIKRRFETLSGCKLVEGYGLTETSPLATANPFDGLNKEGSIGLPVPGTSIAIVDKEDPRKLLPQGEDGEICVSGPQVMKGYWGREEATAETVVDGRLLTGDVGHIDEEGYVFIIDRKKDLVLVSGFNVFPRKVEEGIYRHEAVEEVTVIGVPDDYTGEAVKAFVKLKEGRALDADELKDFLADKLGRHEMPKHVEFRDELPKTMIGKLSKKELVAEEQAAREAASG